MPTERWDVVGVGANSVDFVHLLPGYPQPFGSFAKMQIEIARHPLRRADGDGDVRVRAASACAAKYVGVTGTDENGRRVRAELDAARHRSHRPDHPRRARTSSR